MKASKRILSVLLAMMLLAPVFAIAAFAESSAADIFADKVVALVNAERVKKNLPELKVDAAKLRAAALVRANESAEQFDIVTHKRPNGKSWNTVLKENGVTHYSFAGETLAAGYDTPEEVVAAWMDNEQDRTNLLHPDFTCFGVGIYEGEFKLGDDSQSGYIAAMLFIAESKDRHPDADNAVQAFLRQVNEYLLKGLVWFLNLFDGMFA